jgi:hypothetical protein
MIHEEGALLEIPKRCRIPSREIEKLSTTDAKYILNTNPSNIYFPHATQQNTTILKSTSCRKYSEKHFHGKLFGVTPRYYGKQQFYTDIFTRSKELF